MFTSRLRLLEAHREGCVCGCQASACERLFYRLVSSRSYPPVGLARPRVRLESRPRSFLDYSNTYSVCVYFPLFFRYLCYRTFNLTLKTKLLLYIASSANLEPLSY